MTWFVRVGPIGLAYGPFDTRDETHAWLIGRGFQLEHEGASFKTYEAHDPSLFDAHQAMQATLD